MSKRKAQQAAPQATARTRAPDRILAALLRGVGVDDDLALRGLKESTHNTGVADFRPAGPVRIEFEVTGHDIRDARIDCASPSGLFVVEGTNDVGKTFRLIGLSAALGFAWESNDVNVFLQGEERYLSEGIAFIEGYQTGARSAVIKLSWESACVELTLADGTLTAVVNDGAGGEALKQAFRLLDEGWEPFRGFIKRFIDVQFIPQNKNFLLRVFQESAYATIERMHEVLAWLNSELGDVVQTAEELQFADSALDDELANLDEESRSLKESLAQNRKRKGSAQLLLTKAKKTSKFAELLTKAGELAKQEDELTTELGRLDLAFEPVRDQFAAVERMKAAVTKTTKGWRDLTTAWNKIQRQIKSDAFNQRVETLLMTRNGVEVRRFLEEEDFGIPGLYVELVAIVKKYAQDPPRVSRVFPIRDEHLELEARTLDEAVGLFSAQANWAQDFLRIRPRLQDFVDEIDAVSPEDASKTPSALKAEIDSLEALLAEALKEIGPSERAVRQMMGANAPKADVGPGVLIDGARQFIDQLAAERVVLFGHLDPDVQDALDLATQSSRISGLLDKVPDRLEDMVQRCQDDALALGQQMQALDEKREAIGNERRRLNTELGDAEKQGLAYMREALFAMATGVSHHFDQRAKRETTGALSLTVGQRTFDLTGVLKQAVGEALRDRCPFLYKFDQKKWLALPVGFVDYDSWTVTASNGAEEQSFHLASETGTGRRAAMTVLGMAIAEPEKGVRLLCVDEWGEVHSGLANETYSGLTKLGTPVVALFTRPGGDGGSAVEVSALPA